MIESIDTLKEAKKDFHIYGKLESERREIFRIAELYLEACGVAMDSAYHKPLARCVNQIAYDAVSKGQYVVEARELLSRALEYAWGDRPGPDNPEDDIREFLYPTEIGVR